MKEQREFYTEKFGLALVSESDQSAVLRAGHTVLEFVQASDGTEPFYHFAFNIPENKFAEAKAWLQARVSLLRDPKGHDELYFETWDAHAAYFHDPAGNIVELIARHTLPNATKGPFTAREILYASEIGIVANDQKRMAKALMKAFELDLYHGSLFFVGDAHGLFVIPPVDRLWIPERKKEAAVFPTEVTVSGDRSRRLDFDDLPYRIREADAPPSEQR